MKNLSFLFITTLAFLLTACIKDDFVDDLTTAQLRITTVLDSIEINTSFQFEASYLNNIGESESVALSWSSSQSDIIDITDDGLATGISGGVSDIIVSYLDGEEPLSDTLSVAVGEATVTTQQSVTGFIKTTSSYALEGDFTFRESDTGVELEFEDNYKSARLGVELFVYLSNNENSIANALEIGGVEVFSGSHSYNIDNVGFQDYKYVVYFCKPFNVKVGDGSL